MFEFQALLESKSNERLRPDGIAQIKEYFLELASFLPLGSLQARVASVKAFRCIANGGVDPTILQEEVPQYSPKEDSMQVTDTIYIQNLIRDCGAIAIISGETYQAYSEYSSKMAELRETNFAITMATTKRKARRESMAANKETAPGAGEDDEEDKSVNSVEDSALFGQSDELKAVTADALDYAEGALSLCLELSVDFNTAALLCQEGLLCNALVISLKEEAMAPRPDTGRIAESIELLWNCLESYVHFMNLEKSNPDAVPPAIKKLFYSGTSVVDFRIAVDTLRTVFRQLIFTCYRQSDREVRNEVLIILSLFIHFPVSVPHIINSGLLNDIVSFGTVGDAGRKAWSFYSQPLPKFRNFVTMTDIDLQLKKQMWLMIGDLLMSDDPDIITCVASSPFLAMLFTYIEQDSLVDHDGDHRDEGLGGTAIEEDNDHISSPIEKQNTPPILQSLPVTQLREFQVLAMTILAANAHRMMAEFLRIKGPTRALDVLCKYAQSPLPEHKSLVYHTFLLLNRNVMMSSVVNHRLENHDGIRVFLHFFEFSDDEAARAQSARIMTVMCRKSLKSQQQLRQIKGIAPLVNALQAYSERRQAVVGKLAGVSFSSLGGDTDQEAPSGSDDNGGEMSVFAISILDCIHNAILGNEKSEVVFAQKEGIDALFDILEVSPYIHRSVILRLICDLFDNHRLISYAYAWRSHKTMRSIGQLLAHCWMDEEVRIGCLRDKDGVICNIWNALGDHTWPVSEDASNALLEESGTGSPDGRSSTVARLNTAILAARVGSSGASLVALREKAQQSDMRCVVAAILQLLGFLGNPHPVEVGGQLEQRQEEPEESDQELLERENSVKGFLRTLTMVGESMGKPGKIMTPEEMADQNLSPTDRQVISLATRYGILREGQWWSEIQQSLAERNVVPVDEDTNAAEAMTQRVFAAAKAIQFEQMELGVVRLQDKQAEEDVFFNHIIQQKNQQIKSEYLKRKSGRK